MRALIPERAPIEDIYEDCLAHHGIKGQKWGVRRFQNPDGSLTPAGRERYGHKNRQKNEGLGLMLLDIGLQIAKDKYSSVKEKEIRENRDPKINESDVPKKATEMYDYQDMAAVNSALDFKEKYLNPVSAYKNNCVSCSISYDMRRRGYDVKATKAYDGFTIAEFIKAYKGAEVEDISMNDSEKRNYFGGSKKLTDRMISSIQSYQGNARGILSIQSPYGGHAIAWEKNGSNVKLRDCQINKVWQPNEIAKKMQPNYYGVIRTDSCDVDWDYMGNFIDWEGRGSK